MKRAKRLLFFQLRVIFALIYLSFLIIALSSSTLKLSKYVLSAAVPSSSNNLRTLILADDFGDSNLVDSDYFVPLAVARAARSLARFALNHVLLGVISSPQ